ncbi:hypothetical protein ACG33_07515 [Steroidobacter denitrificans]|uniref:HD/PDEase domain-containing protein n=1 Tax=Steroidobacter denitrificans TaxID=465721 RepID=A0A127F952_STEDE|nr:hypothetical protein [Steroidobacter denitrificans]AMN46946.1 hypothetical protein ACG33_07515 [Steroidobacter denitrificans]
MAAAFALFERYISGLDPRYLPLDTPYHDLQHSLDVCLCMTRLLIGHDLHVTANKRLGAGGALFGILCALFHDAGYLRRTDESHVDHGAELTRIHVSRSVRVLDGVLQEIDLAPRFPAALELVHYTGNERASHEIDTADATERTLGHLLGTADLLAQMADRCYLEKIRDRLYPELVIAGLAGRDSSACRSAEELLKATPAFVDTAFSARLDSVFGGSYRWIEGVCNGTNPYLISIHRQMNHLRAAFEAGICPKLRRVPPGSGPAHRFKLESHSIHDGSTIAGIATCA